MFTIDGVANPNQVTPFSAQNVNYLAWFLPTIWFWAERAAGWAYLPNYTDASSQYKAGWTYAGFGTVGGAVNATRLRSWAFVSGLAPVTSVQLQTDDGFAIDTGSRVDIYGIS
jgi:hypothetical protein